MQAWRTVLVCGQRSELVRLETYPFRLTRLGSGTVGVVDVLVDISGGHLAFTLVENVWTKVECHVCHGRLVELSSVIVVDVVCR